VKQPVLVGGTGRSGSTIVGHILDHHPALVLARPMEVRFITGNDGIADALAIALVDPDRGQAAAELAADRLRNRWYRRAPTVGLHESVSEEQLDIWIQQYLDCFDDDPSTATRTLADNILGAIALRLGADRLVDTTPANARKADRVASIYPNSNVIIVLRDGRDVAASFVAQSFGPDDVFEALDQWEKRMLRSHRAAANSSADQILVVELSDLVERAREATLGQIMEFLDLPDDADMRAWFDGNVLPQSAHGGRWRTQFDADTTRRIDEQYAHICERLGMQGVRLPS
jgi:hypothetical protein